MNKIARHGAGLTLGVLVLSLASAGSSTAANTRLASTGKPVAIKVYKTPSCGCCKAWVQHLRDNGFAVETVDMPDLSMVKQKYGVKPALQACHTAVVNGYVVEGHVPADLIMKLVKEHPAVAGLAVPGMPTGSPGMDGASRVPYDVLTFDRAGRTRVYAHR
jgi:hypothetical protein